MRHRKAHACGATRDDGAGFVLQLVLWSILIVAGFSSLLWLGFIFSFGPLTNNMRASATETVKAYLSGQRPILDGFSGRLELPQTENVTIINAHLEPAYLASFLAPCRSVRCSVRDRMFEASVTYEVDSEVFYKRFMVVWNPSSYYWAVTKELNVAETLEHSSE